MRKTIYLFFISFFWGCLQEDSPPEVLSPGEKQLGNLALFFSQKLDKRLLDHAGELECVSGTLTPLVQHARVGYNAFYGGHYFIIPLQNKQGQIKAGLVYPLKGNDTISGFNLSGDLDTPSVLDERTLGAVSNNGQRFLLSTKFLAWKKEGLSVAPGLYAYAESLDGKHVYRPNPNAPRSKVDGEYLQADVIINFEIDPNTEIFIVEPGPAITVTILTESDIHDLFLDALGAFAGVNGINQVQLTGAGFGNAYLLLEVANEDAIMNGVNLYIGAVQELFDTRYDVSDIPFYYSYYLGDNNSSSPGDGGDQDWGGTGEGGGTAGGGTPDPGGGTSGTKSPVELIDPEKFVAYNGSCWETCSLFLRNYNLPPGDTEHVYQLIVERNGEEVYYDSDYQITYQNAIACIDRHLEAGRPIMVGTSYELGHPGNNDKTTDHFVVITGRGYDESKGMYYYTYMDSFTTFYDIGCNTEINRLYYD
ncbi:MAG: hypothetical protein IJO84_05605, partial [Butyricimonas sp.]|nr:hypothetical protein [Butyricimonas sp.]